jgi:hypothetical protein
VLAKRLPDSAGDDRVRGPPVGHRS